MDNFKTKMKKLFSSLEKSRSDKRRSSSYRDGKGDGKAKATNPTLYYKSFPTSALYSTPSKETIHKIVERGDLKGAEMVIKQGADVNLQGIYGYTPLFYATEKGHYDCVNLLIKSGADVNLKAKYGATALMRAARRGCEKCVELLIDAGADVNAVEVTTSTALLEAARSRSVRSIQLLLKAGVEVNRTNEVHLEFLNDRINKRSPAMKKVAMLLYAAGQTLEGVTVTWFGEDFFRSRDQDEYCTLEGKTISLEWCKSKPKSASIDAFDTDIDQVELNLGLKHKCRDAIRKQIARWTPNANMFTTFHKLGLPSVINLYLLYYVPLD